MTSMAPEISNRARTIFQNNASSTYSNSFRPSHVPAMTQGKPITKSLAVSAVTVPLSAEPGRAYEKDRNRDRLEHRSLNFLRPTKQAAPDRHNDAGEAGEPASTPLRNPAAAMAACLPAVMGPRLGRMNPINPERL